MRISEIYRQKKPVISFEVFPPKKNNGLGSIYEALGALAALQPDFISVTYGAGGAGALDKTLEIASAIKNTYGIEALAHLVGISSNREEVYQTLAALKAERIENILALRGDFPRDPAISVKDDYPFAAALIQDIRRDRDFCIGAACYPEGHIDCGDESKNLEHLKAKQEAGADFFISQLFFDNNLFLRFWENALKERIHLPVSAGIMPILSKSQIERMIFMCGASLPSRIVKLLHRYENRPEDLRKAGIDYATKQILDLIDNGVDGVHIYTMNHPDIARANMEAVRERTA